MYEYRTVRSGDLGGDQKSPPFPSKLASIRDCPKELHYMWGGGPFNGKILEKTLAVVGSRKMTSYGRRVVERLIGPVATAGVTIVSGFMYGVDEYVHKVCVETGGKAIAVLPYGLSHCPPSQRTLWDGILDNGGLIVSEFNDDFGGADWAFPKRNRIIAGLADATMVIEGASKSGSLITAGKCIENDRKLFAVPGPIDSIVSEGTNNLIKAGLASLVTSPTEVLEFFGLAQSAGEVRTMPVLRDAHEEIIYSCARLEPLTLDEISERSSLDISIVGYKTMMMCLAGVLIEKEGKFYVG